MKENSVQKQDKTNDIPPKLTEYQAIANTSATPWCIKIDESTGKATMERVKPSFTGPIFLSLFLAAITFFGFAAVGHHSSFVRLPPENISDYAFIAIGVVASLIMLVICPLGYGVMYFIDESSWPDPRFEYDGNAQSLYFSRENTRYLKNEYTRIVFGLTRGVNAKGKFPVVLGMAPSKLIPGFQFYAIVLDAQGIWHKHFLDLAASDVQVTLAIKQIQKVLKCESTFRYMSLHECRDSQNKEVE